MDRCSIEAALLPQLAGNGERIKLDRFPPCRFVAPAMERNRIQACHEIRAAEVRTTGGRGRPHFVHYRQTGRVIARTSARVSGATRIG